MDASTSIFKSSRGQFDIPLGADFDHFILRYLCVISIFYVGRTCVNAVNGLNENVAQIIYRKDVQHHLIICRFCFETTLIYEPYLVVRDCAVDGEDDLSSEMPLLDADTASDHRPAIGMRLESFTKQMYCELDKIWQRNRVWNHTADMCPITNAACPEYRMPCNVDIIARTFQRTYDQLLYNMETRQFWIAFAFTITLSHLFIMICATRVYRAYKAILKIEKNEKRIVENANKLIDDLNRIQIISNAYNINSASDTVCNSVRRMMASHKRATNTVGQLSFYDYCCHFDAIMQFLEISEDLAVHIYSNMETFKEEIVQMSLIISAPSP